ncbi:capsid assembly protein [Hyphomicrobium sp. ghe19]|uniref:capsid assembly protein n=1 Tax=Hyphomicrobium sp. ghe19 TaxID=2682968 RepID=UPI00136691B8|nr:hypothetical protein HYPP_02622 [Hyphomicrobium sp. ghe19]
MTPANNAERPAWLPPNFNTPEDFVKSHEELRADHTRKAQELAALKKDGDKSKEPPTDDKAAKALTDAGIPEADMQQWSETFWKTGEVPADAYEKLAAVGISKEIIDDYAASRSHFVESQNTTLLNAGGGEENVNKMFAWAEENLNEQQKAVYNRAFDGNDLNAKIIAMEGLKSKYEASEGFNPSLINGGNTPNGAGGVYTSVAQMQADMSDARYALDPAFRAQVEAKLGRSNIL